VTSNCSSLTSGVTLFRHVDGYRPVPVTSVGTTGGCVVVVDGGAVVLVVDDVVLVVDDVVVDDVVVEDVDDVVEPPVTVTVVNGSAGTALVPVHAGAGAGPQPAGVGVPGVQENVTVMIPPGPTSALVELVPRLMATSPPVGVHVVVGTVADTPSGVADSSPEVLFAGVGSVIVVVPVTEIGPTVCEPSVVFDPSRVTFTFAGMVLVPMVRSPRPYPARSTVGGTLMPKVAPARVMVSPAATELGVASPLTVIGSAVVPA
jgi:hypothetical protein